MERALPLFDAIGGTPGRAWRHGALAEIYGHSGRIDDAQREINAAFEVAERAGEHFFDPELYRIKGEINLRSSKPDIEAAERSFQDTIGLARRCEAKWFELRATASLARLLRDTNRRDEARAMLAEIYNWFTEGIDTADLKDAKALLDELA
jgi:predicted ATPase